MRLFKENERPFHCVSCLHIKATRGDGTSPTSAGYHSYDIIAQCIICGLRKSRNDFPQRMGKLNRCLDCCIDAVRTFSRLYCGECRQQFSKQYDDHYRKALMQYDWSSSLTLFSLLLSGFTRGCYSIHGPRSSHNTIPSDILVLCIKFLTTALSLDQWDFNGNSNIKMESNKRKIIVLNSLFFNRTVVRGVDKVSCSVNDFFERKLWKFRVHELGKRNDFTFKIGIRSCDGGITRGLYAFRFPADWSLKDGDIISMLYHFGKL